MKKANTKIKKYKWKPSFQTSGFIYYCWLDWNNILSTVVSRNFVTRLFFSQTFLKLKVAPHVRYFPSENQSSKNHKSHGIPTMRPHCFPHVNRDASGRESFISYEFFLFLFGNQKMTSGRRFGSSSSKRSMLDLHNQLWTFLSFETHRCGSKSHK